MEKYYEFYKIGFVVSAIVLSIALIALKHSYSKESKIFEEEESLDI